MKDLVVVGAGPSGLAAATEAAELGVEVCLVDEAQAPGGRLRAQLSQREGDGGWRIGPDEADRMTDDARRAGVELLVKTCVWGLFPAKEGRGWELGLQHGSLGRMLSARKVLVATGAVEHVSPVPGWQLPGVMTIGAAHVLTNVHRVLPGHTGIVVGPTTVWSLAVTRQLELAGVSLMPQASAPAHLPTDGLGSSPRWLSTAREQPRSVCLEIVGEDAVRAVAVGVATSSGAVEAGSERLVAVDFVCLSSGASPLVELAAAAGCRLAHADSFGGHAVLHGPGFQTTQPGLYVTGDAAGIGSVDLAAARGRLAAIAIAGNVRPQDVRVHDARRREAASAHDRARTALDASSLAEPNHDMNAQWKRWSDDVRP